MPSLFQFGSCYLSVLSLLQLVLSTYCTPQPAQQQFPSPFGDPYTYIRPRQQFRPPVQWQPTATTAQQPPPAPDLPATKLIATNSAPPNPSWYADIGACFPSRYQHFSETSSNKHLLNPLTRFSLAMSKVYLLAPLVLLLFLPLITPMFPYLHTIVYVYNVPAITKNLISVSKFAQDNLVFFEFHPYHCLVKSHGSRKVLLKGQVGPNGLYKFQYLLQHGSSVLSQSILFPL